MNEREKVFIPMSIDQNTTTRAGYFFSPLKSVVMVGGFIPGIIWCSFVYSSSGNSILALIVSIVLYLIVYSYLIRLVVFEERRLKGMMKSLEKNKQSRIEYFWGIDEIDNEGVIHYKYSTGLKKAVIVRVERGSTVGVREDFETIFKDCNLKFVQKLLKSNFSYLKYTKMEKRELPAGILDYSKKLERLEKDSAQRVVAKLNLDTISNFVKDNKSVVVDYYVVYNKDIRLMNTFKNTVNDILVSSYGNEVYFRGTKILNDEEVSSFIADVLNIKSINKKGYYNTEDHSFEDFGELFRLFDKNDNEILLDLEKDIKDLNVLQGRGGKTIDQLEEEHSKSTSKEEKVDSDEEYEEVIYIDEDEDIDLDDGEYEYIYVDEDGNEIDESELDNYKDSIEDKKDKKGKKGRRNKKERNNKKDTKGNKSSDKKGKDNELDDDVDIFSL